MVCIKFVARVSLCCEIVLVSSFSRIAMIGVVCNCVVVTIMVECKFLVRVCGDCYPVVISMVDCMLCTGVVSVDCPVDVDVMKCRGVAKW